MPIGSHLMQPASVNMRSSDDVQLQRLRSSDEVRCNLCAFETRVMEQCLSGRERYRRDLGRRQGRLSRDRLAWPSNLPAVAGGAMPLMRMDSSAIEFRMAEEEGAGRPARGTSARMRHPTGRRRCLVCRGTGRTRSGRTEWHAQSHTTRPTRHEPQARGGARIRMSHGPARRGAALDAEPRT